MILVQVAFNRAKRSATIDASRAMHFVAFHSIYRKPGSRGAQTRYIYIYIYIHIFSERNFPLNAIVSRGECAGETF